MKRPLILALLLTLSATGACAGLSATAGPWADMYDDCNQSAEPDRQIRGCTSVIERGTLEIQQTRAVAYTNRGNAYYRKGEVDRAIADYDQAIALNPNDAVAYNNRGNAYKQKGDKEQAKADFRKALEIDPPLDEVQAPLEALTRRTNKSACKRYFPAVGTTLTVSCK